MSILSLNLRPLMVFEAANDPETDILVWIDGDTYVHSSITYKQFRNLVPESQWLHYLGRNKKWPECGWYGLTLRTPGCDAFLKEFDELEEYAINLDNIKKLEKWDSLYYSEKLKQKLFHLDEEQLKPFFKLENVSSSFFYAAAQNSTEITTRDLLIDLANMSREFRDEANLILIKSKDSSEMYPISPIFNDAIVLN